MTSPIQFWEIFLIFLWNKKHFSRCMGIYYHYIRFFLVIYKVDFLIFEWPAASVTMRDSFEYSPFIHHSFLLTPTVRKSWTRLQRCMSLVIELFSISIFGPIFIFFTDRYLKITWRIGPTFYFCYFFCPRGQKRLKIV